MKRILFLLAFLFIGLLSRAQSYYFLRADSVVIEKAGSNGELILKNAGRDTEKGGVLYNKGGGRTAFKKSIVLNDSTIIIGGDTLEILGGAKGGSALDTASLSLRIDARVKYSDTLMMLYPYLRKNDTVSLSFRIEQRVKYSDTAAMLAIYLRKSDTVSLSDRIELRMKYSDTASLSNRIDGKQPTGNYITGLNGDGSATGPGLANFVLSPTSVTPGTYTNANITVDAKGRVTAASNGSGESAADSTIFSTNYRRDTAVANLRSEIAGKQPTGDYITGLTGDVAAVGPGLVAATIFNGAITAVKIQDGAVTQSKVAITGTPDGTKFLKDDFSWGTPAGGSGQILVSDLGRLPAIKQNYPAQGISASGTTVTNYPITALDSTLYYFTTTNNFSSGTKYGGVLWSTPLGDSGNISAPFGVFIGSSLAEGHKDKHGRLHPLVGGVPQNTFIPSYPDSAGQPSYHMRQYTGYRWYNHGIGGQTSRQVRIRWARDVLGLQLNFDPGDGRGTRTLLRKPLYVIYDGITNDAFNGMMPKESIDNLIWMAQSAKSNNVQFIVCNSIIGLQGPTTAAAHIATVNKFLETGGLEPWGVIVFNQKRFWSDPAYGYDGIHGRTDIVDPVDAIHYTPAGSDSFALRIFQECKIPKLTKIGFINELSPSTPITNYAYVDSLSIQGIPYKLSARTTEVNITTPLTSDTVGIKAKHITTVAGAGTNYGYSYIYWVLDNNIANDSFYTRRTAGSNGANSQYMQGASLDILPENYNSSDPVIDVHGSTLETTDHGLLVKPNGAGATMVLNGGSTTTAIETGVLSIYGTTGLGMNGNIKAAGTNHRFGNFQLTYNTAPSDFGWGLSLNYTAINSRYTFSTVSGTSYDQFTFKEWSGALTPLNTARETNVININNIGFSTPIAAGSEGNVLNITPTYNITGAESAGTLIAGIKYKPTLTSLTNTNHNALEIWSGNNRLNVGQDSTCIGCDNAEAIGAKFRVKGNVRINTIDSTASPANMLWQDPATGEIKKAAVPGGGSSYVFSNGLTETGGTAKLGGILTEYTHISGGSSGYALQLDSMSSISLFSGLEFVSSGIGSAIQMSDSVMNISSSSATDFTSMVFSPTKIKFIAADGSGNAGDVWTNTGGGNGHWAAQPKIYTALLSQSGTNDPTVTVLGANGIGTIVWTRNSTGNYTGTLTGAFTSNKTWLICQKGDGTGSFVNGLLSSSTANTVTLIVTDNANTFSDSFTNMSIEIRVYP